MIATLISPDQTRSAKIRTWRRYLIGFVIVVILIILIGPRSQTGAPLDPNATSPAGARGIMDVLRELGVDPRIDDGAPTASDSIALIISDDLTDEQRAAVQTWVENGGRLVLTDPLSELAPDIVGGTSIAFTEPTIEPACEDPFTVGVERVAVSGGFVYDLPELATGCFPRNDGYWMIRIPTGAGELTVLGGPLTLTNELLGTEDSAVLLVNLLTPPDGQTLHVIEPDRSSVAGESLGDLLPDQVGLALLQIPIAWLALVWWRARRHGQPVAEVTPVRIEASETTVAVGNLLSTAGRSVESAAIIRAKVNREMSLRLGVNGTVDPQTFADVVADRTDISRQILSVLLLEPLPIDDRGLVRYANLAGHTLGRITQRTSSQANGNSTVNNSTSPDVPDTK